jgi:transposase
MVALVRTGRSVESLAREYEPCAATIHEWVRQAAADDGGDPSGLTSEERDELRQLRREVKQLRQERDILSKAAAWFAQNDVTSRRSSNS